MDNRRLVFTVAIAAILFIMYQQWKKDYPPVQASAPVTQVQQAPSDSPTVASAPDQPTSVARDTGLTQKPEATSAEAHYVSIKTDVFDIKMNTQGANIRSVALPTYPDSIDQQDTPFQLMNDSFPVYFVAQSRVREFKNGAYQAIDKNAVYETSSDHYVLKEGQEQLEVPFTFVNEQGIKVTKTYLFKRAAHDVKVKYELENLSGAPLEAEMYAQLRRTKETGVAESTFIHTYTGAVVSTKEKLYKKVSFDDMEESTFSQASKAGWVAMIQHYFLAAWIPNIEDQNAYYTLRPSDGIYTAGVISPRKTIAAGDKAVFEQTFYAGPKIQSTLEELAPGLERTVDFGYLTPIAKPIFWLLNKLHSLLGNWGWAIVILTLMIKIMFYKLSEISYKSMANMRKLGPRMQKLKERYGDDRQKMQQAMMQMYKEEKINPLSGCLPMLVPIPVFIALYWVLLESVELRQASWILWYNDLSQPDPFYVLPIIMAASMFLQQKLNPTPPDPIQARMMMIMPLVFSVMFLFFPSGLVLYWVVNNITSIAQQYVITKRIESGDPKKG